MIKIEGDQRFLMGPKGRIHLKDDDEITTKIAMLFEGECEGLGATKSAEKFGYTRQRYHQLLQQFKIQGAEVLKSKKRAAGKLPNDRGSGETGHTLSFS